MSAALEKSGACSLRFPGSPGEVETPGPPAVMGLVQGDLRGAAFQQEDPPPGRTYHPPHPASPHGKLQPPPPAQEEQRQTRKGQGGRLPGLTYLKKSSLQ